MRNNLQYSKNSNSVIFRDVLDKERESIINDSPNFVLIDAVLLGDETEVAAAVYLKLALMYSQDSLTYKNDMDDNISEVIIQQIVEAFPEDESGWLAYGDILYNKYLFTRDGDALSIMEDTYDRYIELMTGQGEIRKIPKYIYDWIKEYDLYLKNH